MGSRGGIDIDWGRGGGLASVASPLLSVDQEHYSIALCGCGECSLFDHKSDFRFESVYQAT